MVPNASWDSVVAVVAKLNFVPVVFVVEVLVVAAEVKVEFFAGLIAAANAFANSAGTGLDLSYYYCCCYYYYNVRLELSSVAWRHSAIAFSLCRRENEATNVDLSTGHY